MSEYARQLESLCEWVRANPGTSGARALAKIIMDLEGDGPVGELMFSLDQKMMARVLELFLEFRRTGRDDAFNTLHELARERVSGVLD